MFTIPDSNPVPRFLCRARVRPSSEPGLMSGLVGLTALDPDIAVTCTASDF